MKLVLKKAVKGIVQGTEITRLHASCGDVLTVLLKNATHYICDSLYYPNEHIIVFKNQVEREENDISLDKEREAEVDEFLSENNITGDLGEDIEGESSDIRY